MKLQSLRPERNRYYNNCRENEYEFELYDKNIAVLSLGTNYEKDAVTILETAMCLIEHYAGPIIDSSYIYRTVPEYVIEKEKNKFYYGEPNEDNSDEEDYYNEEDYIIEEDYTSEEDYYISEEDYIGEKVKEKHNQMLFPFCEISQITELMSSKDENTKDENRKELIYKCKEYDFFLSGRKQDETGMNDKCYLKYKRETLDMIEINNKIMKSNLETHKNKYNTQYFYNLCIVIRTSIKDALSLLIILKFIEQLMGRKKKSYSLKFGNRKIDIDILFFNSLVIFEKNIKLQKEQVEKIISNYIFLHKSEKKIVEIINRLNEQIEFLCIPHLYTTYRFSILLCLKDMMPNYKHPYFSKSIDSFFKGCIYEYQDICKINLENLNKKAYVLKDRLLYLKEKTHIVGILNVNNDSFSDGSLFVCPDRAVERMFEMVDNGATIIDVGGESSAPYVVKKDSISERDFVIPVLEKFQKEWDKRNNISSDISNNTIENAIKEKPIISIDTTHYNLFKECVEKNLVDVLNDISACSDESYIIQLLKLKKGKYLSVFIMHKRGNPHTMDKLTNYDNISEEVKNYLIGRLNFLVLNGIPRYRIILDVGLGFAKKAEQSIQLLKDINIYNSYPLLLGYSRKRFVAYCVGATTEIQNKEIQNKEDKNKEDKNKEDKNEEDKNEEDKNEEDKNEEDKNKAETCKEKYATLEQNEWNLQVRNYRKDKNPLLCQKIICGGLAVSSYAFSNKVDLVRVHDVLETKAVFDVLKKLQE